mgnify:CR=1 FL=1
MANFYSEDFKVGVLGGGQLGRMLFQASLDLDIHLYFMDPAINAPCSRVSTHFEQGNLSNYDDVYNFGKGKDVVTIEIEHVNTQALKQLEKEGVSVFPQPHIIELIQDKGLQKQFYKENNIPTSDFVFANSLQEIESHLNKQPWVQKVRKGGYDGQGVSVLKSTSDIQKALSGPSILEDLVDFETEISVIVARNEKGDVKAFPMVDMEFSEEANLVEFLFSPATLTDDIKSKANAIAIDVITKLEMVGLLAVEMFVTKSGHVLVNEVAPRPHNSGHQTIEGNVTSQYEQHLRSILNLPLGNTTITHPSVMVNLLGEKDFVGPVFYEGLEDVLNIPGVNVHIYGKQDTKSFRKMGHVTVIAETLDEAKEKARQVKNTLKVKTK